MQPRITVPRLVSGSRCIVTHFVIDEVVEVGRRELHAGASRKAAQGGASTRTAVTVSSAAAWQEGACPPPWRRTPRLAGMCLVDYLALSPILPGRSETRRPTRAATDSRCQVVAMQESGAVGIDGQEVSDECVELDLVVEWLTALLPLVQPLCEGCRGLVGPRAGSLRVGALTLPQRRYRPGSRSASCPMPSVGRAGASISRFQARGRGSRRCRSGW